MSSYRAWLTPPRADDPEEALRARILHWLLLTALFFVLPLTVMIPVMEETYTYTLPLYLFSLLGAGVIFVVLHVGRIGTAGMLFAALGFVITLWASFASGGVGSPQLSLGVLVIMLTGFLWSGPAAIGMALLISASLFALELARDMDLAPEPFIAATRFTEWAALSTVLAMSAVFLQIFVRTVHAARRDAAEKSARLEQEMKRRADTEASLHRAQKLEALGRLSGGIAHDFNNILTVMLGETEMLEDRTGDGRRLSPEAHQHVAEIRASAERARALTQQLLAFSRHPVGVAQVLDPDHVLEKLEPMLRRLIREDVSLRVSRGAKGTSVRIDAGQLEQVVMNLVLNACDAMPRGGELKLATDVAHVDAAWSAVHPGTEPGDYVTLAVRDSGVGIASEDLERIFDPFFTTKDVGDGTGLGLASAHGIVTRVGGDIVVESELDHGTTFRVYLPAVADVERRAPAPPPESVAAAGHRGTLLLCEDDAAVRKVTSRALTRAGYDVVAVARAEQALAWLRGHDRQVDLLVSDVIMPGINGGELARLATEERPGMRVLLVSGYASNVLEASGLPADVELLQKPYTAATLLTRIESLVDRARAGD